MSDTKPSSGRKPRHTKGVVLVIACVFVAAVIMGIPTIGGGFVGGDDHRLALNHVLVNRPSIEHALKLFTTPHRDLYQPLPLLSFSAEFAIGNVFGLFDGGIEGGSWLFHLTNVLLHAINAVLVWLVIRRLHERIGSVKLPPAEGPHDEVGPRLSWVEGDSPDAAWVVATAAALLFAVHPLQVEVVAWTNGRMMLLSTLFALLSILSFARWLDRARPAPAALTILFVLLCAVSKIRIELPVLFVVVALARRVKFGRRFFPLWVACGLITGVFVFVNMWATAGADLFAEAAEHLRGPRLVRVILALAWYFQHLVWPVGLASYYPTPPLVSWSNAGTWRAIAIVAPTLVLLAWMGRHSRVARLAAVWFFAALAVTLPFVPARNILAADRYMYLPIIGLLWLIAAVGARAYQYALTQIPRRSARLAVGVLAAVVIPACIGMSWYVGRFYSTPLLKTTRVADLFPDTPRVWERLGWTLYSDGDCERAIEYANKELRHDAPNVQAGAYQLMGMAEVRRGNMEDGLSALRRSIEVNPENPLGEYYLAKALDDLGRAEEAVPHYEAVARASPLHNPTLDRLGWIYHHLGRRVEARERYQKALANNEYEVRAIMGLVELDIDEGTPESLSAAERRLTELLRWMDDNADAWTNLGVVRQAQGRAAEAREAYADALRREPNHVPALMNLAQMYRAAGDVLRAWPLFVQAVGAGLTSIDEAIVIHDVCVSRDAIDRAVAMWEGFVRRFPASVEARAFLAWSRALAGDTSRAGDEALALLDGSGSSAARDESARRTRTDPLAPARATLAYIALARGNYEEAGRQTETLCATGEGGAHARGRLLGALERFDRLQPDDPWTFCLTARLLIRDGRFDAAKVFIDLCHERCRDDGCREQVQRLRSLAADALGPFATPESP